MRGYDNRVRVLNQVYDLLVCILLKAKEWVIRYSEPCYAGFFLNIIYWFYLGLVARGKGHSETKRKWKERNRVLVEADIEL